MPHIIDTMKDSNKPSSVIVRTTCLYCLSSNTNTRTGTCNDCGTTNPGIGSQTKRMRAGGKKKDAVSSESDS